MSTISWFGAPYKTYRGCSFYHAICIEGEAYRVNDVVYLRNPDDPKQPFIAKISELFSNPRDKSGTFFMKNRWYYRHADVQQEHTIPIRTSFLSSIDARPTAWSESDGSAQPGRILQKYEIFESTSSYFDTNDAESIDGKALVIAMPQFARMCKLESTTHATFPSNIHVCSLRYNEANGRFARIGRHAARSKSVQSRPVEKKRRRKTRPAADAKRPRVGDQFQADWLPHFEPEDCNDDGDDVLLLRQRDFCMEYSVSLAREHCIDVGMFVKKASSVDRTGILDETVYLNILHSSQYQVEDAIGAISKEVQDRHRALTVRKGAGTLLNTSETSVGKGAQTPPRKNASVPSTPKFLRIPDAFRPSHTPPDFMTSDWAYEIVNALGRGLPPFRRCSGLNKSESTSSLSRSPKNGVVDDEESADECMICKCRGVLLMCDGGCGCCFHLKCLGLKSTPTEPEWLCLPCRQKAERPALFLSAVTADTSAHAGTKQETTPTSHMPAFTDTHVMSSGRESKIASPLPVASRASPFGASSGFQRPSKKKQLQMTKFFPLSSIPSPKRLRTMDGNGSKDCT